VFYLSFREKLLSLENNIFYNVLLVISILFSVFGPPVAIIYGVSITNLLFLIFFSNILFVVDTILKFYLHGKEYLLSLDFVIDLTAIISAILEFLLVINLYSGKNIPNLRILRALNVISRFSRTIKALTRIGGIDKSTRLTKFQSLNIRSVKLFKKIGLFFRSGRAVEKNLVKNSDFQGSKNDESKKYLSSIKSKMQTVVMLLMGYIILRFGSTIQLLDPILQAKADILFFLEMIFVMIIIGGIIDFYLNKIVGKRFQEIQEWVKHKSEEHGFFKDVNLRAHQESKDEVDFLEKYIGIVLDKADEFPESIRKFMWGVFQPKVRNRIIFLSDIENYSGKTSNMSAKDINHFLDEYTTNVVNILVKNGAEIDKYVGDSVIAFFHPNDADKALKASIEINNNKSIPKTRIGIHFDAVIETYVGPKGYRQMDHFSEGISIAQRVEDYNKELKTYILVTDDFYELLSEKFKKMLKKVSVFKPKGAKRKVVCYSLK
jgi:class 3 adenylate cyclase